MEHSFTTRCDNNLSIIVQAGGRGSRLRHHTWNKPKCLVSVKGKPLLYHLFDQFPNSYFYIIGDYLYDQLANYLQVNKPDIDYKLIKSTAKGTCSGISDALQHVPDNNQILLTWSDLIINSLPVISNYETPIVYTTRAFTCRWTVHNNVLKEEPGNIGIPGIFFFNSKQQIQDVPKEGEFVKWFSKNITDFNTLESNELEELGDFASIEYQNDRAGFSRFFNQVTIDADVVHKKAIDPNYLHLIEKEQSWYKSITDLGFRRVPKIHSIDPYIMQRINGNHAYQLLDLSPREKRAVLADYLDTLTNLHDLGTKESTDSEVKDTYIDKTINRVNSIKKLIPNFDKKSFTINGTKCQNVFQNLEIFNKIFDELTPKYFTPIHGDPTFSNTLIDKNLRVWFIDPRGYFSQPGIWGDPVYDFAKVYYSAIGNYDSFNRRKFKLVVDDETAEIIMQESAFAQEGKEIFNEYFNKDIIKIEILHGLIWLSLSGYVKDDIDSIVGSFYLGLYYLEQGLKKL